MIKRALVLLMVLVSSISILGVSKYDVSAAATVYYVSSTTGSNTTGTGTSSKPWKTVAYAASKVAGNQGHTIYVLNGTYSETASIVLAPQVNLVGQSKAGVILKGSFANAMVKLTSSSVINGACTIKDLTIDGNTRKLDTGIEIFDRENITIENVAIKNTELYGIYIEGTNTSNLLDGIEIKNCTLTNTSNDFSGEWCSGAIHFYNLVGAQIHDNTINENEGYGIKSPGESGYKLSGVHVYNNTITITGSNATWGRNISIEIWQLYDDCEVYNNTVDSWISLVYGAKGTGSYSVKAYDNSIICPDGMSTWGIEIADLDNPEIAYNYMENVSYGVCINNYNSHPDNNLIHHNIMKDLDENEVSAGLYIQSNNPNAVTNTEFYNNTVINSSFAGVVLHSEASGSSIVGTKIKNNIFVDTPNTLVFLAKTGTTISNTQLQYNNHYQRLNQLFYWDESQNMSLITGTTTSNNTTTNPLLNYSGAIPNPYYAPSSTSTVIDSGINVGLPYNGSAPDRGAIEY